jgi:hypothetical protein
MARPVRRGEVHARPGRQQDAAQKRLDFCNSAKRDQLQQAESEAEKAFNDADVAALVRAEATARKAAQAAPAGAECAVNALDSIRFHWNHGANNLASSNYTAKARSVREFQRRHQLLRDRY